MNRQVISTLRICSNISRTSSLGLPKVDLYSGKKSEFASQSGRRVEKMEHLKLNPFYSKYTDKLKNFQESSGEEFQKRVDVLLSEKKKEQESKEENKEKPNQLKSDSLDSILNLELVQNKSAEEISVLWKQYFEKKDVIYASITTDEYREIERKAKEFSKFLYPLPRQEGYEFFVQQWNANICHFTTLLSYQTYKENSPSCLSLRHYTELAEEKGIVLMVGYPDLNILSVHESQLLALQVKMFYGIQSALKFNLVRVFNNSPETFQHMQLVREFENYKKDVREKKKNSF